MVQFANVSNVAADALAPIRPAKLVPVSASVVKNMRTPLPSGGWGRYSLDQTPYMVEPMDTIASRVFEAVIFAGPAQSGKTLGLIDGAVSYSIVESPADCQVIQTSQRQANDYSKFRLDRYVDNSPDIAQYKTSRGTDDNVEAKQYRNGASVRIGWPSVGQVSGKAPKFVVQVQAWGPGLQTWFVDRFALKTSRRSTGEINEKGEPIYFPLDPASYLEDWQRLIDKVIKRTYPLADQSGRVMRMRAVRTAIGMNGADWSTFIVVFSVFDSPVVAYVLIAWK